MKAMKNEKTKHNIHVKAGDKVILLSGKDKGKSGLVKKVIPSAGKVIVEGLNQVTKAMKPNPMAGIQGGLTKVDAPVDSSVVMVCCPSCEKPTRIKHEVVEGKKVRVCKKCGEKLDV